VMKYEIRDTRVNVAFTHALAEVGSKNAAEDRGQRSEARSQKPEMISRLHPASIYRFMTGNMIKNGRIPTIQVEL
ncbi:hypothetical protein ACFL27_27650, partial [candidate division CSSED10-310 bacterium]